MFCGKCLKLPLVFSHWYSCAAACVQSPSLHAQPSGMQPGKAAPMQDMFSVSPLGVYTSAATSLSLTPLAESLVFWLISMHCSGQAIIGTAVLCMSFTIQLRGFHSMLLLISRTGMHHGKWGNKGTWKQTHWDRSMLNFHPGTCRDVLSPIWSHAENPRELAGSSKIPSLYLNLN